MIFVIARSGRFNVVLSAFKGHFKSKKMNRIFIILIVCAMYSLQTVKAQEKEIQYKLESGKIVKLPLHYENWTWMMATFSIPLEQARQLLPDSLIPITISEGEALISFGAYHYPIVSDLAPYDEFLISIPVQYNKVSEPNSARKYNPLFPQEVYAKGGSYIHYLPVTTEESYKAGSEIWGFPKVVRKMVFEENNKMVRCKLYDGNDLEMTIEIEKIKVSKNSKDFTYCAYTKRKDKLLRTCVDANGNYGFKFSGINATVTLGTGDISKTLKSLNISKKPVQVFFAENVVSDLPEACDYFPVVEARQK